MILTRCNDGYDIETRKRMTTFGKELAKARQAGEVSFRGGKDTDYSRLCGIHTDSKVQGEHIANSTQALTDWVSALRRFVRLIVGSATVPVRGQDVRCSVMRRDLGAGWGAGCLPAACCRGCLVTPMVLWWTLPSFLSVILHCLVLGLPDSPHPPEPHPALMLSVWLCHKIES